jgi:hypothetical protein
VELAPPQPELKRGFGRVDVAYISTALLRLIGFVAVGGTLFEFIAKRVVGLREDEGDQGPG